jgi:Helix-turn-helix domain
LRDPFVGKALSLMHAKPARNWTIEDLAKDVGLSRSVLAERFVDLVGMPPMQYLAKWRMQIASGLLTGGTSNIAKIAAETGYGSEAAFSRAFKKIWWGWHRRPGVTASNLTGGPRRYKSPSLAPEEQARREESRPRYRPGLPTKGVIAGDHHDKGWPRLHRRAR